MRNERKYMLAKEHRERKQLSRDETVELIKIFKRTEYSVAEKLKKLPA